MLVGLVILCASGAALLVGAPWNTLCPTDWNSAAGISLTSSSGDVMLEGRPFHVGGNGKN